jgi:hypothetical protein
MTSWTRSRLSVRLCSRLWRKFSTLLSSPEVAWLRALLRADRLPDRDDPRLARVELRGLALAVRPEEPRAADLPALEELRALADDLRVPRPDLPAPADLRPLEPLDLPLLELPEDLRDVPLCWAIWVLLLGLG